MHKVITKIVYYRNATTLFRNQKQRAFHPPFSLVWNDIFLRSSLGWAGVHGARSTDDAQTAGSWAGNPKDGGLNCEVKIILVVWVMCLISATWRWMINCPYQTRTSSIDSIYPQRYRMFKYKLLGGGHAACCSKTFGHPSFRNSVVEWLLWCFFAGWFGNKGSRDWKRQQSKGYIKHMCGKLKHDVRWISKFTFLKR